MRTNKLVALILAAGYSSRMGDFKPLLSLDSEYVITRTVNSLRAAGIADIRVIVGYRAEDLLPVLSSLGVTPVLNDNYDQGMFSS
ncbi:MAG: nucleotidyltransferase family protein, partial [Peptococcales bacterium]